MQKTIETFPFASVQPNMVTIDEHSIHITVSIGIATVTLGRDVHLPP